MRKFWTKMVLMSSVLTLGLVVASCSKSNEPNNGGGDEGGSTEPAFLSFAFDINYGKTKLNPTDLPGTADETKVSEVYLVLYNATTGNLLKRYQLTAATNGNKIEGGDVHSSPDETQFVSKAKLVDRVDMNVIMLINPTTNILAATVESAGKTLADYIDATESLTALDLTGSSANKFFMTNANGPRLVKKEHLKYNETDAQNSPFTLNVQRAVARIDVQLDEDFNQGVTKVSVDEATIGWALDNINKKTFWIRQAANTHAGTMELRDYTTNNMIPSVSPQASLYATDPNMSGAPSTDFIQLDRSTPANLVAALTNAISTTPASIYVLENTMNATEQADDKVDNAATMVRLKAIVEYATIGTETNVLNYYSYEGNVFTHAQIKEWKASSSWPSSLGAGFAAAVTTAENEGFDFGVSSVAPTAYKKSTSGIIYHHGGLNIYAIPVKHFDTDQGISPDPDLAKTQFGYYGVVRNNVYVINLKSITGPGDETTNEAYISADVTILPWTKRTQDVNLN